MKNMIFWDITSCSLLSVNRRFGGTYRLHIHLPPAGFLLNYFFDPEDGGDVPPKRQSTLSGLHGVISQKIVLFRIIQYFMHVFLDWSVAFASEWSPPRFWNSREEEREQVSILQSTRSARRPTYAFRHNLHQSICVRINCGYINPKLLCGLYTGPHNKWYSALELRRRNDEISNILVKRPQTTSLMTSREILVNEVALEQVYLRLPSIFSC
jgi:hypothetical protein